MGLGIPELIVILFAGVIYLIPIAAAIWLLLKVKQMFETQQKMAAHIEAIARIVTKNDAAG
jgi:hypothetical protein